MKKSHMTTGRLSGAAWIAGGLLVAGSTLAGMLLGGATPRADAAEAKQGAVNYVKSASLDAISGVKLDEELAIVFNAAVLRSSVGPDTILIRTGTNNGEQARGRYIVGRFMYDKLAQRRVVIRPEAVQEYFQLVKGLSRVDATRKATHFIDKVERRGRFKALGKIDRGLKSFMGTSGAGTRLDDKNIVGTYPVLSTPDAPLAPYRLRVAGDDELWKAHLNDDFAAYAELAGNPEYERFWHEVDPATGSRAASSVLRSREYRRVLIDRRNLRRVMFVPDIPIRADLGDTGYKAGSAYSIIIPTGQPGVFNTVLTMRGRRPLLQAGGKDFSTLYTTIPNTGANAVFNDAEARVGIVGTQAPRLINVTPPNGETFIDRFTDWEDPDAASTPIPARRTFTIRLRFAQPLDPRSVNPTTFLLSKVAQYDSPTDETPTFFDLPVAVGTFLNQTRLGIVEVELTPATDLDPLSQYELAISGTVRSLGGEFIGADIKQSFRIGAGEPPLSRIYETFLDTSRRALPSDPETLGQVTTARWAPGAIYDPEGSGKLVASFMPFLGSGLGAPADPSSPTPFDPNDPSTFPVTDLLLGTGESIAFRTEGLDPTDPATFGKQIEYNYHSFRMDAASALAVGRFPLVIRSQTSFILNGSLISVAGKDGEQGVENADIIAGSPTGGRGGTSGPGGFRGGNGAFVGLVDANNAPILDANSDPIFDPNATDGQDGAPGYAFKGGLTGGGGSGGFSGRREEGATIDIDPAAMNGPEPQLSPERITEPGGGGGHATRGGDATAARGTQQTHADGHNGGIGGLSYGYADFRDQPLNADGAPVLGEGAGGAGGGGGGGEMEPDPADSSDITSVGPEDSGGGGGGGGGGAFQVVARTFITVDQSIIDCSGGDGGRSRDPSLANFGQGAGGGGGAGGGLFAQCYGEIEIINGSTIDVGGGVGGRGEISPDPQDQGTLLGDGGTGGLGYIRLEDKDGAALIAIPANQFIGVLSQATFRPVVDLPGIVEGGSYPSHQSVDFNSTGPGVLGAPMVENTSVAYTSWYNTQLDTPTLVPVFNDPLGDPFVGTKVSPPNLGTVDIFVRSADNDILNSGHPNPFTATPWTPLVDAETVSDRRFMQARFNFTVPFSFAFDQRLPYVDIFHVEIELR